MTAYVITCDQQRLLLPVAMGWSFHYGVGIPCDSFTITVPWYGALPVGLERWATFEAEHEGERVFTGVIDECIASQTKQGATLEVTGRGYGARLLDNEAVGQDYITATLDDILQDHVTPFGVTVGEKTSLPSVSPFQVDSGTSAWGVLYDFCQYYGDILPRFDKYGRLILGRWDRSVKLQITDGTPVTRLIHRQKRYGVRSAVLVRDRVTKAVSRVADASLLALGYRAQQVVTMPGRSTTSAMNFDGEHRLAQSQGEMLRVEVTVPTLEFLEPGCLVEICRKDCLSNGTYVLVEAEVGVSEQGAFTRLELGETSITL